MKKVLRILVLDDDPEDLEFMQSLIKQSLQENCEVTTVATLEEAVETIASRLDFDWIVADYLLGGEVGNISFHLAKQMDQNIRAMLISDRELEQLPEHIRGQIEAGEFTFITKKAFAECDIAALFGAVH